MVLNSEGEHAVDVRLLIRRYAIVAVIAVGALAGMVAGAARSAEDDDRATAVSLATMLTAARSVISEKQALIDDPTRGDKGLTGRVVLDLARPIYREALGRDPLDVDPKTPEGALLHAEMDAIVAAVDNNQASINSKGIGFKGFIPAVFGRLVSEEFAAKAGQRASIKITAPPDLVRNRKSRPDRWETDVIAHRFEATGWAKGTPFAEMTSAASGEVFRMATPEYYTQSCLSCHGQPKGSLDITGYPKEGAQLGDLGGVISIVLKK